MSTELIKPQVVLPVVRRTKPHRCRKETPSTPSDFDDAAGSRLSGLTMVTNVPLLTKAAPTRGPELQDQAEETPLRSTECHAVEPVNRRA